MTANHRSRSRRAACAAGHPAWVVQFGYAPAARRCVDLLRSHGTQNDRQIAAQAGYALGTVRVSLNALKRLDQVECNEWDEWSAR